MECAKYLKRFPRNKQRIPSRMIELPQSMIFWSNKSITYIINDKHSPQCITRKIVSEDRLVNVLNEENIIQNAT